MTSKDIGLIGKYDVERTDGKPVNWCFVLEDKDPLALPALKAYARAASRAGYRALAKDLKAKVVSLEVRHGVRPDARGVRHWFAPHAAAPLLCDACGWAPKNKDHADAAEPDR